MKWENNGLDSRLVADDGEILERVLWHFSGSAYKVESTGKLYTTREAAKRAAERAHGSGVLASKKDQPKGGA